VAKFYGDIFDSEAVATAMTGCDVVYYCVVDVRAELRDPRPLFQTNVEGLRRVLDVAAEADLHRFVFLSTIGTIAVGRNGESVTEDTSFNWPGEGGAYIESRRQAEELVLTYARERGVPAVALNVSNPSGPPDWQPRQGTFVQLAALGKMPFYLRGVGAEVVGIDDVAARHGGGHRLRIEDVAVELRHVQAVDASGGTRLSQQHPNVVAAGHQMPSDAGTHVAARTHDKRCSIVHRGPAYGRA
jgi:nucleoside-diphosphate-sugar epimerase